MNQKQFFEIIMGRRNWLKMAILGFFFGISSPFRMMIEVHVRERFGYRYFSLFMAICITVVLSAIPYMYMNTNPEVGTAKLVGYFLSWYACVALFAFRSWQHYLKVRRKPGDFNFDRHTKYNGDVHPGFYMLAEYGLPVNPRTISVYYEPGLFLIIGIILALLSQPIGYIIITASVVYSLGYLSAFTNGDEYIANLMDDKLLANELSDVMKTGWKPRTDQGFDMLNWPNDRELGKQVAESMRVQNEVLNAF